MTKIGWLLFTAVVEEASLLGIAIIPMPKGARGEAGERKRLELMPFKQRIDFGKLLSVCFIHDVEGNFGIAENLP